MPFSETSSMEERVRMLADYDTGAFKVTELSARYGVSRDTFYAWLRRRGSGEPDWFKDRSHAVRVCPHRTPAAQSAALIAARQRFPRFGAKKLLARLTEEQPGVSWPAASTVTGILKGAGLVEARRRRRRAVEQGLEASAAQAANEEWGTDFKGWFRTGDGKRCDPLTITDTYCRYLIETRIVPPTVAGVQPVFAAAFRACGLPLAIRCDNGAPFGSTGAGGLTRLSVWWLKLGVEPHFITPASPQENGRHERFHRTLKENTSQPPAASCAAQQDRFDVFRQHYNLERPHEALGQIPPDRLWQPSSRVMPERLDDPWYDADHQVRRVRSDGTIKWRGDFIFIGEAFSGELVGIAERDRGLQLVRFCRVDLGVIDPAKGFLRFAPRRYSLRAAQETRPNPILSTISPV
jgi:transposase InsO family protein